MRADEPWLDSAQQCKQGAMRCFREKIESADSPEKLYPPSREPVECYIDGFMDAKFQEDGYTLLMHAAKLGKKKMFCYLTERIRYRLGLSVLVKQLKGSDLEGAPLLFLAASSRTEETCFDTVKAVIGSVLGTVGFKEQLTAVDHRERGIMTYAAKSNHHTVFVEVCVLMKEQCGRTCQEERKIHIKSGAVDQDLASRIENKWKELVCRRDDTGRTLLHHASEAGSAEVLEKVAQTAVKEEGFDDMSKADKNGRTPIMYVLRNGYNEDEEVIQKKVQTLWDQPCTRGRWMLKRKIRSPKGGFRSGRSEEERFTTGSTELLHAARGGPHTFALALEKSRTTKKLGKETNLLNYIDDILGVETQSRNTRTDGNDDVGERGNENSDLRTWGRAMLLAAAARGGYVEVLKQVESGIKLAGERETRQDGPVTDEVDEDTIDSGGDRSPMRAAIRELQASGRSLLTLAILSGEIEAVKWVNKVVKHYIVGYSEVWNILSGQNSKMSSLACAAMTPITAPNQGEKMFFMVFTLLQVASIAANEDDSSKALRRLFIPPMKKLSPLAVAVLMNNWHIFRAVYGACPQESGARKTLWSRTELLNQVPEKDSTRTNELYDMQEVDSHTESGHNSWSRGPSAIMWPDMVEAIWRAENLESTIEGTSTGLESRYVELTIQGESTRPESWRDKFWGNSKQAVKQAAERRNFDALRELVGDGFPLHEEDIPELLELIGDFEQDIMEIIVVTVGNAMNPLVAAANISKQLKAAQARYSMQSRSYRRLQEKIDALVGELLESLPHTVRGMGKAALGRNRNIFLKHNPLDKQVHHHDRLGNLVGFIIVAWIFEPTHLSRSAITRDSTGEVEYVDPLQSALDRGSEALNFIHSPLVLDYMHVKFSCTLPNWTSGNPFNYIINEGFYLYDTSVSIEKSACDGSGDAESQKESILSGAFLLRLLRGWDEGSGMAPGITLVEWILPHRTVLPGLQFILAGILGKPETFYEVPVIRFMFATLSYMVTVGLFWSCVMLRDPKKIPPNEVIFYIFVVGMLWREVLEFLDGVPCHARVDLDIEIRSDADGDKRPNAGKRRQEVKQRGTAAVQRYVFYDTWNVLDALTIICIMVAFVFRVVERYDPWGDDETVPGGRNFFIAQLLLAISGPLLFTKAIMLSQIDHTLGPMTQILWRMVAHLARFSAFVVLVMASFALAFHALFAHCADEEIADDALNYMGISFGTFSASLVSVFEAALGQFVLDEFNHENNTCHLRPRERYAGMFVMILYLIIMAILLMNLLIAVLSTAHTEVYQNAEKEFYVARTRLIQESARAVVNRRLPPPLNLVTVVCGFLIDAIGDMHYLWRVCWSWVLQNDSSCERAKPWSSRHFWLTTEGAMQRIVFALIMGASSWAVYAMLWIISVPYIGWSIFREFFSLSYFANVKPGKEWSGYLSSTIQIVAALFGWFVATAVAAIYSALCISASLLLFILGLAGVLGWWRWRWSEEGKRVSRWEKHHHGCPVKVMPGEEHGSRWMEARQIANSMNSGMRDEGYATHFNLSPFLKCTTGLDMEHLNSLISRRDDNEERSTKLDGIDRDREGHRISAIAEGKSSIKRVQDNSEGNSGEGNKSNQDSNLTNDSPVRNAYGDPPGPRSIGAAEDRTYRK